MKSQPHPYDRRHLKEVLHRNELGDQILAARGWAQAHLELVLIGVLLVAAMVFGGYYFIQGRQQRSLDASLLLSQAQSAFQQAAGGPADQAQGAYAHAYAKYQAIVGSYEGSIEAKSAELGMANADLAMGKVADAQREYAELDSGQASDPLAALAGYGKAKALELEGKVADARAAYEAALAAYPGSVIDGEARAAVSRLGASRTLGAPLAAKKGLTLSAKAN